MRKRLFFLICAFFFAGAIFASAQSNEVLDIMIEQEDALYAETLYLVFTASGFLDDEASPEQALSIPLERGWVKAEQPADRPIRLGELSHIIMKAFDLPGGLLYRIFPGPRYAARELAFYGVIREHRSCNRRVSGTEAIRIIRNAVEWKEANL